MKNVIVTAALIVATAVASFFVGVEANTDKVVKTVDPVEHCVTAALKNFPTPIDVQLDECKDLNEDQKKEANDTVMNFLDEVAEYEMTR